MANAFYEKRIVPIYSAIESEKYKEAIQLCTKHDISTIPLVMALLAYAKVCNNERKEGLDICTKIKNSLTVYGKPDVTVLETLTHAYRRCRLEEEVASCYEIACQIEPSNQTFAIELFFSYTRLSEAKKMQIIAQKLFKLQPKSMFIYWSVTSMQMQLDLPVAMLTVGERMLRKAFYENNPEYQPGAEALELLLKILLKQGKLKDALQTIDELMERSTGPPVFDGEEFEVNADMIKLHSLRKHTIRCEILQQLIDMSLIDGSSQTLETSKLEESLESELLHILSEFPDQWSTYTQLIELSLKRALRGYCGGAVLEPTFLPGLQEKHPALRGPRLAEMHLLLKLGSHSMESIGFRLAEKLISVSSDTNSDIIVVIDISNIILRRLVSLMCSYLDSFRTKQCCFSDLKPLLAAMSQTDTTWGLEEKVLALRAVNKHANYWHIQLLKEIEDCKRAFESSSTSPLQQAPKVTTVPDTDTDTELRISADLSNLDFNSDDKHDSTIVVASSSPEKNKLASTLETVTGSTVLVDDDAATESTTEVGEITVESSGGEGPSKSKSKNRKKKKKSVATSLSVSSTVPTTGAVGSTTPTKITTIGNSSGPQIQQAGGSSARDVYRAKIVELLCSLCKVEQIEVYCQLTLRGDSVVAPDQSLCEDSVDLQGRMKDAALSFSRARKCVELYSSMKSACEGGVGGQKEVQPGDEMLILACAVHRVHHRQYLHELYSIDSPSTTTGVRDRPLRHISWQSVRNLSELTPKDIDSVLTVNVARAIHWAGVAMTGVEGSPFNYSPRLELLEPLRLLAAGEAAYSVYTRLGVRYIQVDSMSYLITPLLLESGMLSEASRQYRHMFLFHTGARRDTAEMITKCFKFGNYTKALELSNFSEKCKNSTQLALANAELPLIEFAENCHEITDTLKYLENAMLAGLTETHAISTDQQLADLSDNFDFDLLVRCDMTPEQEKRETGIRLRQMRFRICTSQFTYWLLVRALQCEVVEACRLFDRLEAYLSNYYEESAQQQSALNIVNDFGRNSYIQWSQEVDGGGTAFEAAHWRVFTDLLLLYLHLFADLLAQSQAPSPLSPSKRAEVQALHQSHKLGNTASATGINREKYITAPTIPGDTSDTSLDMLAAACMESVSILRYMLLERDSNNYKNVNSNVNLDPFTTSSSALLSPDWIRRMSLFTRSVGAWAPLMLQNLLVHVVDCKTTGASTSASRKKVAAAVTAALLGPGSVDGISTTKEMAGIKDASFTPKQAAVILDVSTTFAELLGDLWNVVNEEGSQDTTTGAAVTLALQEVSLPPDLAEPPGSEAVSSVISNVLSSQKQSCGRFRDLLGAKLTPLRTLLSSRPS